MFKLPIYLYKPRIRVFTDLSGTSTGTVDKMYQYNSKIARGTKQTIQFQFLNGDQRPQNVHANFSFVFKLYDPVTNEERISSTLNIIDDGTTFSKRGIAELTLLPTDTQNLKAGLYNYAVYQTQDAQGPIPAFVDGGSRVQGNIELVDGVLPAFRPSLVGTFTGPNVYDHHTWTTGPIPVTADPSGAFNAAAYFTNFTGTLTFFGTLDNQPGPSTSWATLGTHSYTNQTATLMYDTELTGNWTYIKADYVPSVLLPTPSGTVDKVLVRS